MIHAFIAAVAFLVSFSVSDLVAMRHSHSILVVGLHVDVGHSQTFFLKLFKSVEEDSLVRLVESVHFVVFGDLVPSPVLVILSASVKVKVTSEDKDILLAGVVDLFFDKIDALFHDLSLLSHVLIASLFLGQVFKLKLGMLEVSVNSVDKYVSINLVLSVHAAFW